MKVTYAQRAGLPQVGQGHRGVRGLAAGVLCGVCLSRNAVPNFAARKYDHAASIRETQRVHFDPGRFVGGHGGLRCEDARSDESTYAQDRDRFSPRWARNNDRRFDEALFDGGYPEIDANHPFGETGFERAEQVALVTYDEARLAAASWTFCASPSLPFWIPKGRARKPDEPEPRHH